MNTWQKPLNDCSYNCNQVTKNNMTGLRAYYCRAKWLLCHIINVKLYPRRLLHDKQTTTYINNTMYCSFHNLPFLLHPGILMNTPYGWTAATWAHHTTSTYELWQANIMISLTVASYSLPNKKWSCWSTNYVATHSDYQSHKRQRNTIELYHRLKDQSTQSSILAVRRQIAYRWELQHQPHMP